MCITYCDITGIQHTKVLCTLGSLYVNMHPLYILIGSTISNVITNLKGHGVTL